MFDQILKEMKNTIAPEIIKMSVIAFLGLISLAVIWFS